MLKLCRLEVFCPTRLPRCSRYFTALGSRASWRPSPRKLKAITVTKDHTNTRPTSARSEKGVLTLERQCQSKFVCFAKTSEPDFAVIDFPAFFRVDLSGSMAAPSI